MTEITPLVQSKRIQLEKTVNGDLPLLRMDSERILQVLRNLIGNAAKFTPEKGRITVSARAVGAGVEVSVQDTGPGIPAERLPTVFEKFTGSDLRGGTGLGSRHRQTHYRRPRRRGSGRKQTGPGQQVHFCSVVLISFSRRS